MITSFGKDIENRTWRCSYRGPIFLHAGVSRSDMKNPGLASYARAIAQREHAFGGIVGYAEIVDCVSESDSPWFFGPYGFVLRNSRPLPFTPCLGKLGFFEPPPAVAQDLSRFV